MKRWVKWTLLSIAVVLLLGAGIFGMYRIIGTNEWTEQRAAVLKAYDQTILYTATDVKPFVGDRPYMVVYGRDKLDKDMMVWVSEKDVHVEYATDGISAQDASDKVTARDPGNRVIRVSAGTLFDDYVWEVYYRKKEDDGYHYYYDYYRFSDGQFIDTFRLTLND